MMLNCLNTTCISGIRLDDGVPYGTDYLVYAPWTMTLEQCAKLCLMNNFTYSAITKG